MTERVTKGGPENAVRDADDTVYIYEPIVRILCIFRMIQFK